MSKLNLHNKRVCIREDFNVPLNARCQITDDTRIKRALPTIQRALAVHARVIILSHLGRPSEGEFSEAFSLAPIAVRLSELLGQTVPLIKNWIDGVNVLPGECVLCENVRFLKGENANDAALSKKMAALCDVFVMDAFATAHRAQASTTGIAEYAPIACAGPLLEEELNALRKALTKPKHPIIAIVGGAKVSTKFEVLIHLIDQVDVLLVGGGIANTFLAAKGIAIGKSLYEANWIASAKVLLKKAQDNHVDIPLPVDVVVSKTFSENAVARQSNLKNIAADEMILDVGHETTCLYYPLLAQAGTIIWNGPVGVFEFPAFANGTRALAQAIADSDAFSIAGGGDTIAAIMQFGVESRISYISTGGGAFLEWMEGKTLPAIAMLERKKQHESA